MLSVCGGPYLVILFLIACGDKKAYTASLNEMRVVFHGGHMSASGWPGVGGCLLGSAYFVPPLHSSMSTSHPSIIGGCPSGTFGHRAFNTNKHKSRIGESPFSFFFVHIQTCHHLSSLLTSAAVVYPLVNRQSGNPVQGWACNRPPQPSWTTKEKGGKGLN